MSLGSQTLPYSKESTDNSNNANNYVPYKYATDRHKNRASYHGDIYKAPDFNYNNIAAFPAEQFCRTMGPSCHAVRLAVAALNRLDDFSCEKIGAGFFSEVFKVTHKVTGQVMVLKMNMSHSNRPNMLREVQLMNKLCHPNILRFMGVCVHEGQLHALTEFINGGSLEQLLLNKTKDLSWATRVKLALDMAYGMRYLHSQGIFHRDLTSKNVLIKLEGDNMTAVVGDFGLAEKIPDPLAKYRLPTVGSPYWMSPECLRGEFYNEKADVFSFGIILCETIARIEADPDFLPRTENFGLDYIAFSEMCSDCPHEFLKLAFHCCMMDPKQRPSFADMVERLEIIMKTFQESTVDNALCNDGVSIKNEAATNYKMLHRRSKSEDTLLSPNADFTSPSDKARCHFHMRQKSTGGERIDDTTQLTPKHIGEVMSLGDPYYRPGGGRNQNPFASITRFRDGKKILASSRELFSSCFELPSPSSPMMPPRICNVNGLLRTDGLVQANVVTNKRSHLLRSNSLPSSTSVQSVTSSPQPCTTDRTPTVQSNVEIVDVAISNRSSTESQRLLRPPWENQHLHHRRNRSDDNMMNSAGSELASLAQLGVTLFPTPPPVLMRRGSCESGFFSVGGDVDRNSTSEDLSPEMVFDDSSSSASSSSMSCTSSKSVISPRSSYIDSDDVGVEDCFSGAVQSEAGHHVLVGPTSFAKGTRNSNSNSVREMQTCDHHHHHFSSQKTHAFPRHHEEKVVKLLQVSASQSRTSLSSKPPISKPPSGH